MSSAYVWVKTLHIVFIASWFAGLFYLPRIFVNLAMETHPAARERLLLMARKLYRFMTILAVPAIALGLWLWFGFGFAGGWLHAKTLLVVGLMGYHWYCGRLLAAFAAEQNTRSPTWYRVFNEVPVLVMLVVVWLVVGKPF